jgi:hypothetical protein
LWPSGLWRRLSPSCRQFVPLKRWYPSTRLHDAIILNTIVWIFTTVKTSNFHELCLDLIHKSSPEIE